MVGSIFARNDGRYTRRATGGFFDNRGFETNRAAVFDHATAARAAAGRLEGVGTTLQTGKK